MCSSTWLGYSALESVGDSRIETKSTSHRFRNLPLPIGDHLDLLGEVLSHHTSSGHRNHRDHRTCPYPILSLLLTFLSLALQIEILPTAK